MFEFLKKYGHKIAVLAHHVANAIEEDGPAIVSGLRTVSLILPGPVGAVAAAGAAAGAIIEKDVELVAHKTISAATVMAPPPYPAVCPLHGVPHADGTLCRATP